MQIVFAFVYRLANSISEITPIPLDSSFLINGISFGIPGDFITSEDLSILSTLWPSSSKSTSKCIRTLLYLSSILLLSLRKTSRPFFFC